MNKCKICNKRKMMRYFNLKTICIECDKKRKQNWLNEFIDSCNDAKLHDEYPSYVFGSNGKIFNYTTGKYLTIYFGSRACTTTLIDSGKKEVRVSANRLIYEVFCRKPLDNEIVKPKDGNIRNLSIDNLQLFKRVVGKTTTDQVIEIDELVMDKSREYDSKDINDQLLSDLGLRRKKGIIYYCQLDYGWFYKN